MGERLVINFIKNNECVMNTYQHWNGFTRGALDTTISCLNSLVNKSTRLDRASIGRTICKVFNESGYSFRALLRARMYGELSGAGMETSDFENEDLRKEIGIPICTDRDMGILSFSKEAMCSTDSWGEEIVDLNVDNLTANIGRAFWREDEGEDYSTEEIVFVNFPPFIKDLMNDSYNSEQIKELLAYFKEIDAKYENKSVYFKDGSGNAFALVE